MKIIYYGSSEFSVPVLQCLIDSEFEVVLVITQPDKKKGRGQKFLPTEVKVMAQEHGIDVWTPATLRSDEFCQQIKTIDHDVAVVASYGKIIPGNILKIPKHGYINVHSSLLPKYRGASPIHGALLNGDEKSGVTIMKMDEGLDTGDIMLTEETVIEKNDDIFSLTQKIANAGGNKVVEALRQVKENNATYLKQKDEEATFTKKIAKTDGIINWSEASNKLINKDKAYKGWPGIQTTFRNKEILLEGLSKVEIDENIDKEFLEQAGCGTIIAKTKKSFCFKVVDGLMKADYYKIAGKNKLDEKSFISGYQPKAGETFGKNN